MGHEAEIVNLLEALAGREPRPADMDPGLRSRAERLLARGRSVHAESAVPKSTLRKALRVFRESRKRSAAGPTLMRLVFDSWFEPAPALRRAGPESTRFLRYDGPCRLELQVRETARGVEVFGQIDPADAATEVHIEVDGKERRAAIDAVGSFRFARLRPGVARVRLGDATIEGIRL